MCRPVTAEQRPLQSSISLPLRQPYILYVCPERFCLTSFFLRELGEDFVILTVVIRSRSSEKFTVALAASWQSEFRGAVQLEQTVFRGMQSQTDLATGCVVSMNHRSGE